MKCSEYLWKYLDMQKAVPGDHPEMEQGLLRQAMAENGDTTIVSDTTGEPMNEREALSVLGRADGNGANNRLLKAYRNGQKSLFVMLVEKQNMSDDEYEAAKKKAEEEAAAAEANG